MNDDEYLNIYSKGFKDGYAEAQKNIKNVQYPMKSPRQFKPIEDETKYCEICNQSQRVTYTCWRNDCPFKTKTIKII